ncbi:hypothetical protein FQA39_LY07115 [Lamprigera yunnana]|nr:hypothetical protein FQA39_LY07115 [Lamprigera yunnana]
MNSKMKPQGKWNINLKLRKPHFRLPENSSLQLKENFRLIDNTRINTNKHASVSSSESPPSESAPSESPSISSTSENHMPPSASYKNDWINNKLAKKSDHRWIEGDIEPGPQIFSLFHTEDYTRFENQLFEITETACTNDNVMSLKMHFERRLRGLDPVKMEPIQNYISAQALKSDAVFDFISNQLKTHPEKAKHVNAIFLYKITKDGKIVKEWTIDLKSATIYEGYVKEGKPNTTITIADEDFVDLTAGKLNPLHAFMQGKLKVTGNLKLAQKLGPLLKARSKL